MDSTKISHGRGGAANINPDAQPYVDGSIVREGEVGDQGTGAYSLGRGGTGNIASPHLKPTGGAGDADVVPETAMREGYENYHMGRGGEGNVHKDNASGKAVSLTKGNGEDNQHGRKSAEPERQKSFTGVGADIVKKPPGASGASKGAEGDHIAQAAATTTGAPHTANGSEHGNKKEEGAAVAAAAAAAAAAEQKEEGPASATGNAADADADASGSAKDPKKSEKERRRAEWREKNPPPEHDGLGDRGAYWVKSKIFG